ncbi:DUF3833 family protein [Sphingomonas sp. 28-63-12]|uniref:DUF3833 family protein n=1 Tax=Sphingomonas sp. 28-63-12 TaxID=1970434 RepID=UPI000BCC15A4|nr:MAG: hypothetical protein B7Y47_08860 [Sphingomonas sp. 28-63-12]
MALMTRGGTSQPARLAVLVATVLGATVLSGCVAVPHPAPLASAPRFAAIDFFTGPAEGHASLKVIFGKRHRVIVHGLGRVGADGILVLDQTVEEAGKPPKQRQWRISEIRPDHYAGSLTDATGGVTGETNGNHLHLRFTMKGGLDTQQYLTLAPDGQSARNILVVRKWGLTLAVLDETIRRVGAP